MNQPKNNICNDDSAEEKTFPKICLEVMHISILKNTRLISEVQLSIHFIKRGICELKKGNVGFNEEDYITLILLSTGFEHLMKCIICLRYYHINKEYPSLNFIKKNFGHDLHKSKKYIEKELEKMNYGSSLATKNDIDFLKNNQHLDNFVSLLSQFGNGARYYNLDIVMEGDSDYKDPRNVFDELIDEIIKERPRLKELRDDISKNKEFDEKLAYELIVLVEKFARALSRLFSLGDFGSLAKTMTGNVSCFFLMDADLGKAEYCTKIV